MDSLHSSCGAARALIPLSSPCSKPSRALLGSTFCISLHPCSLSLGNFPCFRDPRILLRIHTLLACHGQRKYPVAVATAINDAVQATKTWELNPWVCLGAKVVPKVCKQSYDQVAGTVPKVFVSYKYLEKDGSGKEGILSPEQQVVGLSTTRSESVEETGETVPRAEDAARKALEQAFQGKQNILKKWDEEIKSRQLASGDGGSAWGGGGGGGDGDGGGSSGHLEPWDWGEIGEVFMATTALILLYMLITMGPEDTYKFIVFWAKVAFQRHFRIRGYSLDKSSKFRRYAEFDRTAGPNQKPRERVATEGGFLQDTVKKEELEVLRRMRLREQKEKRERDRNELEEGDEDDE